MVELNGRDGLLIYRLKYHGGPADGLIVNSFRPYDSFQEPNGAIYLARCQGEECLDWIDDWTRDIHLHHCPEAKTLEWAWPENG